MKDFDMLQIDSAMGSIFDAIGAMLTKNGQEDASGARRAVAASLADDDYAKAAMWMGCTEGEARKMKEQFERPEGR